MRSITRKDLANWTRWTYDPVAKVWPRVFFASSTDLLEWSDPVWAEPWGIDPELFRDARTGRTYLNLMAPNNNDERLWGLAQCEVDLGTGRCVGEYASLWNGTMVHDKSARPEGPKMFWREGWYQLRTPYTQTLDLGGGRLVFRPNVFGLSDRDTPAAVLRKQTSLNMSFAAEVLAFEGTLGQRNRVGVSTYLSEFQHQDIGVKGCVEGTGMCVYAETRRNGTVDYWEQPLNASDCLPRDLKLHARAEPLVYRLGYGFGDDEPVFVAEVGAEWQAFAPEGWFVFGRMSFALFATGEGRPWPYNAPEVGFVKVIETYFEEDIPDYDEW